MKPAWLGVLAILLLVVTACGTATAQESPTPTLTINEEADEFLKVFIATDDLRQDGFSDAG